ncbi:hypothetical protein BASA60_001361 [Batrachochytrium salamandrivorans]|nr:hypothetical protein BASA60_001361 [Batrachochytrium salamandrivorans]
MLAAWQLLVSRAAASTQQTKPASVGVPAIIPISPSASASIGGDVSPTTTQRPQAQRVQIFQQQQQQQHQQHQQQQQHVQHQHQLGHTAVAVEDVVATPPVSSQDIISAATSALATETDRKSHLDTFDSDLTGMSAAAAAVAAAAASSHSSARRRFKATGISGTQHAVSVAALAAVAANDHSADSDRSVTGLMAQMASAPTLGAASRTPQPTLVAKSVGDARATKGASSGAKKDKRRGRTKKPALFLIESANEDADEKHYKYGCFLGGGSGTLSGPRCDPRRGRRW